MIDKRRRRHAGDPDLIECLYCHDRMRSLGPHLYRIHQVSAVEYRAEHRLPAGYPLMAASMRAELSEQRREAMEADPSLIAGLHTTPDQQRERLMLAAAGRTATDGLPMVREARRRGAPIANAAAVASKRARLDGIARAAGFESMDDAIERTWRLSSREAAERIGVGATTVKRWRRTQHKAAPRA